MKKIYKQPKFKVVELEDSILAGSGEGEIEDTNQGMETELPSEEIDDDDYFG